MRTFTTTAVAILAMTMLGMSIGCESHESNQVQARGHYTPPPHHKDAGCGSNRAYHKDIVQTAQSAGQFNTLLTAATEAGLVETLKSPGPFTVFAPTDEAFAKLPDGTVEALLADKEQLRAVLLYHVLSGRVPSAQITAPIHAKTVNGATLDIRPVAGGVHVGPARVIQADVEASNGVIHVIDTVLIPPK